MILTLKAGVSKKEIDQIIHKIKDLGFTPSISKGTERVVIGVIGEKAIVHKDKFETLEAIDFVTQISKPYKLVSREFKKLSTVVSIGKKVKVGGKQIVMIGGPCSVDTRENLMENAREMKKAGVQLL